MIALGMIIGVLLGFLLGFYTCTLMVIKDRRELKRIMEAALKEYAKKKERKGKWIFGETMGHSWMKCSECCVSQDGQTSCFTYCPNCGAKMEADE